MAILKVPVDQNDHIRGPAHAPITLVEYGDYECPHCAAAHPIVDQVQLSFGGRMRFVFRHFPLTEIHPHAEIAAESAEIAGAAGLFWDMHDALFENQSSLSVPTIFLIGAQLGLPEVIMRNALETGQYRKCAAISWAAYAAARMALRLSSSTVCGMMVLTITHLWYLESKCASPPMRVHNGFTRERLRSA